MFAYFVACQNTQTRRKLPLRHQENQRQGLSFALFLHAHRATENKQVQQNLHWDVLSCFIHSGEKHSGVFRVRRTLSPLSVALSCRISYSRISIVFDGWWKTDEHCTP